MAELPFYVHINASGNDIYDIAQIAVGSPTVLAGTRIYARGLSDDNTTYDMVLQNLSGGTLFAVRNDGNVGIGTIAPAARSHVRDTIDGIGTGNPNVIFETTTGGVLFESKSVDGFKLKFTEGITDRGSFTNAGGYAQLISQFRFTLKDYANVSKLWMDSANGYIGIGSAYFAADAQLHIQGKSSTNADYAFKIENSTGNTIINGRNDQKVYIKNPGGWAADVTLGVGGFTDTLGWRSTGSHRIRYGANDFSVDVRPQIQWDTSAASQQFITGIKDDNTWGIFCAGASDWGFEINKTSRHIGISQVVDPTSKIALTATGFINGLTSTVDGGYGILATANTGVGIRGVNLTSYGIGVDGFSTNNVGVRGQSTNGVGGFFSAPVALLAKGIDATSSNWALQVRDVADNALLYVRNDSFVGAGTNIGNNAWSTFSHKVKPGQGLAGYLWSDFFDSTGTTGLTFRTDADIASGVRIFSGVFGSGGASIFLDGTTRRTRFGGYGYSEQMFEFLLNYQGATSEEKFVVSSGEHTQGTGGNIWFYGAANSASNTGHAYAAIYGVKENAIDDNKDGKLSFRVRSNASPNHTAIERMSISSTGTVNMNSLPISPVGLNPGDLWNNAGVVNII